MQYFVRLSGIGFAFRIITILLLSREAFSSLDLGGDLGTYRRIVSVNEVSSVQRFQQFVSFHSCPAFRFERFSRSPSEMLIGLLANPFGV